MSEHLMLATRGFELAEHEFVGGYDTFAVGTDEMKTRPECRQKGSWIRMRLGKAEITANRANAPNADIGDLRAELAQRRQRFLDQRTCLDLAMGCARADNKVALLGEINAVEVRDALQVDQTIGVKNPHLQRQQEFGAAGIEE
jgi:hypothetical protein